MKLQTRVFRHTHTHTVIYVYIYRDIYICMSIKKYPDITCCSIYIYICMYTSTSPHLPAPPKKETHTPRRIPAPRRGSAERRPGADPSGTSAAGRPRCPPPRPCRAPARPAGAANREEMGGRNGWRAEAALLGRAGEDT